MSSTYADRARSNTARNVDATRHVGPPASGVALEWRARHTAALAAVGALEGAFRMAAPGDGDPLWGARSGWDTVRTGDIPRRDLYSWSAFGHSWIPSSWAWNVLLGVIYRLVGMAGFVLGACALGVALGWVVAALARRAGALPMPTVLVLAVIGTFALGGAPRATTVSVIAGPLVLLQLPSALTGTRRRRLRATAAMAATEILWINLHSGGLVGPVLTGAAGLGLAARYGGRQRRCALARLPGVVALVSGCCLATPYGASLIAHAPRVRAASAGVIEEWRPYSLSMLASPTGSLAAGLVLLAVAIAYRARRYERLFILVVLLVATLAAVRFTAPLLVFVVPELALGLGRLNIRPLVVRVAAAVVVAGLITVAVTGLAGWRHVEAAWASPRLVAELPAGCRLFNDDGTGGAVILLRHDVPVWTDGRNDMYGRQGTLLTLDLRDAVPGTARWLDRHLVTCVLLPSSDRLVQELGHSPLWRVVDSDGTRTLLVRGHSASANRG